MPLGGPPWRSSRARSDGGVGRSFLASSPAGQPVPVPSTTRCLICVSIGSFLAYPGDQTPERAMPRVTPLLSHSVTE